MVPVAAVEASKPAPALAQRRRGLLADHAHRLRQCGAHVVSILLRPGSAHHSHSMVAGGLPEMS